MVDLDLTARSDNLAARSSFQLAGFSYRRLDADGSRIRHSQFNLRFFSGRSQNANTLQGALRSYDINLFFTGELSRLNQRLGRSQLVTLAEQCFNVLLT